MTRLNVALLLADLEDLPPQKLEIVLEYVFDKLPEEAQRMFIHKHTVSAEDKARGEALASVVHEIDHEVERLAGQVRAGDISHHDAAYEFIVRSSHRLLIGASPSAREGLYKDFRISPEPGWSCMRRAIWGSLRLLSYPVSHFYSDDAFVYVDYHTGTWRVVHDEDDEEQPAQPADTLRVVAVSDTHLRHRDLFLPEGDVLVHCGDVLLQGGDAQPPCAEGATMIEPIARHIQDFEAWLEEQRSRFHDVLLIGGNHDRALEDAGPDAVREMLPSATYLCDSGALVGQGRLSAWGTGYSASHGGFNAGFQYSDAQEAQDALDRIPSDGSVQLLLTHGPPQLPKEAFVREQDRFNVEGTFGCPHLLETVTTRVRPAVHIFGHDHQRHGAVRLAQDSSTLFICATSVVDGSMVLQNPPIVVDIPVLPAAAQVAEQLPEELGEDTGPPDAAAHPLEE